MTLMQTANEDECVVCGEINPMGREYHSISCRWNHKKWWACEECRPEVLILRDEWAIKETSKATKEERENFKSFHTMGIPTYLKWRTDRHGKL